jgi:hypothetical protein
MATEQEATTDDRAFAQLRVAISTMAAPGGAGARLEELRLLYTQKQEWARHYNGLIWSVTAILLPVALGGLALSFRNEAGQLQIATLCFAAFGSSLLLYFWSVICNRHRELWEREFKTIHLIEAAWGLRSMPAGLDESGDPPLSAGSGRIKRFRIGIAWGGVALWVIRILVELARG